MSVELVRGHLCDRLRHFGLELTTAQEAKIATYLWLLAKWNDTINLTALPLDPPTDEAIDRLIIEPVIAAKLLKTPVRFLVDLGTGGGSPAIPFSIATDVPQTVMVESRARKCAFLREVSRQIGLKGVQVENARIEAASARTDFQAQADVVTMRAVRADQAFFAAARTLMRDDGVLFRFGSAEQPALLPVQGLAIQAVHELTPSSTAGPGAVLTVLKKSVDS